MAMTLSFGIATDEVAAMVMAMWLATTNNGWTSNEKSTGLQLMATT
jgi:hypothetical protein